MHHRRNADFRLLYAALPQDIRNVAGKQYAVLKQDPRHPSLRFKKVGANWSARIGRGYRALANEVEPDLFIWFWIGTHAEYDRLIS